MQNRKIEAIYRLVSDEDSSFILRTVTSHIKQPELVELSISAHSRVPFEKARK